jgi:hypothetical protein
MRVDTRRVLLALAIVATSAAVAATAAAEPRAFRTSQAAMLSCPSCGNNVIPIITTGETLGSYRFESIPDGIAVDVGGRGDETDPNPGRNRFSLYVNHETSTVPFPFNSPWGSTQGEANQNDFDNSQLSHLTLNRHNEIVEARMAIASAENYQRFCSNYLATAREGFDRPILFANEEAQDWVYRSGTSWPGPSFIQPGTAGAEQAGAVVAYDVRSEARRPIYGMGRHNHENSVAIPGYDELVILSGDDTFFTTPISTLTTPAPPQRITYDQKAWSQLYSYIADDTDAVWNDEGDLWAFVSDTPGYDDYYDFQPGDTTAIVGHFVKVPKSIATGKDPVTGEELLSTDFPGMLPPPPSGSTIDSPPGGTVSGPPPDGPQWVLDQWGNEENVFRFVRLEDIAYDKRPGMSNVLYLIDSGRGTAGASQADRSTNGRVWKMVLDEDDPTKVTSLEILIEGDDQAVKTLGEIHQPDNIEATKQALLITEDPGSSQQFTLPTSDPNATTARLWKYDLQTGAMEAVASVNQGADEGPTDVDGQTGTTTPGALGSWEASGIVDASHILGRGWFYVTVQAHTLWVQKADGPDAIDAPNGKDYTYKREGGQLLAIRIPGA